MLRFEGVSEAYFYPTNIYESVNEYFYGQHVSLLQCVSTWFKSVAQGGRLVTWHWDMDSGRVCLRGHRCEGAVGDTRVGAVAGGGEMNLKL